MKLKFKREIDRRWYAVLPEWTGDKADLEMVCGADKLLEILGNHSNEVEVLFRVEEIFQLENLIGTYTNYVLELMEVDETGGYYRLISLNGDNCGLIIWLCNVTLFALNVPKFPNYIVIK